MLLSPNGIQVDIIIINWNWLSSRRMHATKSEFSFSVRPFQLQFEEIACLKF